MKSGMYSCRAAVVQVWDREAEALVLDERTTTSECVVEVVRGRLLPLRVLDDVVQVRLHDLAHRLRRPEVDIGRRAGSRARSRIAEPRAPRPR